MITISLIDPSPTARAALAAALRSEFSVVESPALSPGVASTDIHLIVAVAEAVKPDVLSEPPFAAVPCLIVGSFSHGALRRPAPLLVVAHPEDPSDLIRHVHILLAQVVGSTGTSRGTRGELRPPFVPAPLLDVIQRAARAHLIAVPTAITGERGTGKRTIARALHHLAGYGALVRVTPLTAVRLTDGRMQELLQTSAGPVTLVADGIDAFPGDAQAVLVECLAEGTLRPAGLPYPFWLLVTTAADLRALSDAGRFDPGLATRLAEMVIEIPPLRARPCDIPAIARDIMADLARTLGLPLSLGPEAEAQLERLPWPGNLGELTAVLRRTAILSTCAEIEARHLVLAPARPAEPVPSTHVSSGAPQAPHAQPRNGAGLGEPASGSAAAHLRLELILTELAHELKNPMVTIKTFAQHLPSLLEDAELRTRFASLTDEAIARMDGLLENVLDFARLGPPRLEPVGLPSLIDETLAALDEKIVERGAQVRRQGWELGSRVIADEGHLTYALRNLFESLVSEIPRQREIAIHVGENGTIALRFIGAAGVTAKLQSFLGDGLNVPSPAALPLRFTLARAVILQNGGRVAVDAGTGNETLVTVSLPAAGDHLARRQRSRATTTLEG
jgi:signal transduction histidine kinase